MPDKQSKHRPHTDFRHRSQIPMPAVDEVEQHLTALLSPSLLAPRQLERRDPRQPQRLIRLRQRRLTLPVMVAIIVSLVWRRMPAVAEVHRVLAREGLLWAPPLRVSPQALSQRLDARPAAVMGQLFAEVWTRLHAQAPSALPHPSWGPVREPFTRLAMVAGAPLEALRQKPQGLREREGLGLAGTIMVMVDALRYDPRWQLCTADAAATDTRFAAEILAAVPAGALLVFDLGGFSVLWFDDFTASHRFFVTRMREKTAYRTVQELSRGWADREEIMAVGRYRSNPCQHPLRRVSVLWQGVWDR
jgi:hypothetical protein